MASINTNAGASQAQQALASAQRDLAVSRKRIATGRKIASAKDDGAISAIATRMTSEQRSWGVANESLARGQSLIETASAGLDAITGLLQKAREKALALRDPSLDGRARAALSADVRDLFDQIDRTALASEVNGRKPLADNLTPSVATTTTTSYTNPGPSAATPASLSNLINFTSGGGSRTFAVDGGATAGRIDLYLDLYSAQDVVEVWQGGQRVAATGQPYVGGGAAVGPGAPSTYKNILSFDYNPASGQGLEFRFNEAFGGSGWQIDNVSLSTPPGPLPTTTTTTTSFPTVTSVATAYNFVSSPSGDLEGVASRPMTLEALGLDTLDLNDTGSLLGAIDSALGQAVDAASYFGERGAAFDRLIDQNRVLADTLETGVGNLVDADLAKESARLEAGQVQESLATKALAIANAAPQWVLGLFKR